MEKARIPGVIEGRSSSLVPLPQAQDSTKKSICVRDTETGSEAQNFLENHILSAHSAKGDTWKVPQEGTSREKKRVTRTGGKKPLKKIQVVARRRGHWEAHTILQLLVLGEGPIWEHVCSSEHSPGVLQHLREPCLAE